MIGYRPHPNLLSGSGGGSGGAGVDQTARDAVAAADAVNSTQATEIGALKAADTAFDARVAAGETKDGVQDTAISGLQTADVTLAGRASALEGRQTTGESKDTAQDADLVAHAGRLTAGETKDVSQDADLANLHAADKTLAGRATALEGRATSGEAKDVAQDVEMGTLRTADAALRDRATALETKASANDSKDVAQDKSLSDMDARITAVAAQGYDDAPIRKSVADETKARTDADTALGVRVDGNVSRIKAVEDALKGGSAGGFVLVGPGVRVKESVTDWDVAAHAPAGATHYRIVPIGGGESGVGYSVNDGTAASLTGATTGGKPGIANKRMRARPINGETLTATIGAGGDGGPTATEFWGRSFRGFDTVVTIKKDGQTIGRIIGAGGTDNTTNTRGANTTTLAPLGKFAGRPGPIEGIPGSGSTLSFGSEAERRNRCSGQDVDDGPAPGGGSNVVANSTNYGGTGGSVRYTPGEAPHVYLEETGGIGGTYSSSVAVQSQDGVNPHPDTPGSYGPGGGGNAAPPTGASIVNGGKGGFPGGGGGSAWLGTSSAQNGTTFNVRPGAGGGGCFDVFYGRYA